MTSNNTVQRTVLNKENILKLADHIEGLQRKRSIRDDIIGFNMRSYTTTRLGRPADLTCKTACCIAGWAAYMSGYRGNSLTEIREEAAAWLGLESRDEVARLFQPEEVGPLCEIEPREAAATLRRLARTGKVRWEK